MLCLKVLACLNISSQVKSENAELFFFVFINMDIKGRERGMEGKTRRNLLDDDVMIDVHSWQGLLTVHSNQNSGIVCQCN